MCKVIRVFFAVTLFLLFSVALVSADTVILKNGKQVKCLILDEFKDRIVVSTADGEKIIMKYRIRSVAYENEAKTLARKAEMQMKRHQHIRAYHTYAKALELDPELEEARQQLSFLRGYLETKMKYDIIENVKDRKEKAEGVERKPAIRRVTEELGIVLAANDNHPYIKEVVGGGSHGLKSGDKIVSIWGVLMGFRDVEEVAEMLLRPEECRMVIERKAEPVLASNGAPFDGVFAKGYQRIIGAKLKLVRKGVIVEKVTPGGPFEESGIAAGDHIYTIKGRNTRYMPLARIIGILKDNEDKKIEVVIRRDVTIWRKKEKI